MDKYGVNVSLETDYSLSTLKIISFVVQCKFTRLSTFSK